MEEKKVIKLSYKVDTPELIGNIEYILPHYVDRMRAYYDLQLEVDSNNTADLPGNKSISRMEKIVGILQKYVTLVSIKIKETGEEIESIDDLLNYQEGFAIAAAVSDKILGGIKLGKS